MICNECETVAHCAKHGCIPKQPAPVLCCGQYETCTQACTPRGEFLAKRDAQAAQPAPVQEPDAYLHDDGCWTAAKTYAGRQLNDRLLFAGSPKIGVYTPPPAQRQWVDLTDEQRNAIIRHHSFAEDIIRVTAAKLKEKNYG